MVCCLSLCFCLKSQHSCSDREPGTKLTLSQLREQLRKDPELQNLTEEKENQLLQKLDEHRTVKKMGVRSTALAVNADIARTMTRLGDEVCCNFYPICVS
jgi:hypothetical protein